MSPCDPKPSKPANAKERLRTTKPSPPKLKDRRAVFCHERSTRDCKKFVRLSNNSLAGTANRSVLVNGRYVNPPLDKLLVPTVSLRAKLMGRVKIVPERSF